MRPIEQLAEFTAQVNTIKTEAAVIFAGFGTTPTPAQLEAMEALIDALIAALEELE